MMLRKVISGGQTGVDRAGLDAALNAGIPVGGYCPKGRKAEDGVIPEKYPLIELDSPESYYRTEMNVIKSDGTLIINIGNLSDGTKLTNEFAVTHGKPRLIIQLYSDKVILPEHVIRWINGHLINVLNIAGPRESKCPGGIYREAYDFLEKVFNLLKEDTNHDQG
jgi:Circularly permutated YpsA SLOG family